MVVLSLSTVMRLARPQILHGDVFQLDAQILGNHLATGQDADIFAAWLCGDRRSRALFTARPATCRAGLLTQRSQRFAFTSSAIISSGLPILATFSRIGRRSSLLLSFFSLIRM